MVLMVSEEGTNEAQYWIERLLGFVLVAGVGRGVRILFEHNLKSNPRAHRLTDPKIVTKG
jgi:hypothetical protein